MYLLSKDELLLNRIMEEVPIDYIASVYYELKSNGYNFSWQQASTIAFHMWKNESKDDPTIYEYSNMNIYNNVSFGDCEISNV